MQKMGIIIIIIARAIKASLDLALNATLGQILSLSGLIYIFSSASDLADILAQAKASALVPPIIQ